MVRRFRSRGGAQDVRKRGRRLIPDEVVEMVRSVYELTKPGNVNQYGPRAGNLAETARITRLSKESVRKIINGTHGQPSPNLGSPLAEGERKVAPQRCLNPECGAIITVVPCRGCAAREALKQLRQQSLAAGRAGANPASPPSRRPGPALCDRQRLLPLMTEDGPYELLGLKQATQGLRADNFELKPAHRRRYERVRRRMLARVNQERAAKGELPF
jgi:hypothetical protein